MLKKSLSSILSVTLLLVSYHAVFAQQGVLDPTFNNTGTTFGIFQDPLPTFPQAGDEQNSYYSSGDAYADGRIVVVGAYSINYKGNLWVRRLLPNGTPDTSFGTNGYVQTEFYRYGPAYNDRTHVVSPLVRIQPSDGKILVAAKCTLTGSLGDDLCLVRYNQNGTLDASFGGNSILVTGGNTTPTTYTMDAGKVWTQTGTSFGDNTNYGGFRGAPNDLKIAADGTIYVFGVSLDWIPMAFNARSKGIVAIYSPNGTLQRIDSYYDGTSNANSPNPGFGATQILGGAILSNGGYLAVGLKQIRIGGIMSASKWTVWTNNSGSTGGNFLNNGNGHPFERATSVQLLRSNKILVAGTLPVPSGNGSDHSAVLIRYNSNLSLDTTFGTNGILKYDNRLLPPNNILMRFADGLYLQVIQPDGKILAGDSGGGIRRFNPNGTPDHSFGIGEDGYPGDENRYGIIYYGSLTSFPGGADPRVSFGQSFLRLNGRIVNAGNRGGGDALSNRGVVSQFTNVFRNGGIMNDFDNDGRADLAVFSNGSWQWLRSFNNDPVTVTLGTAADKIVPADYDGDGRTDPAVFRNGKWTIKRSSNNLNRVVNFGQAGDRPVPGDFNGDGLADFGVFRPANATWYVLLSNPIQPGNVTQLQQQFGAAGDTPVLGDFDGDGKSDFAIFRNGTWSYRRSSNGQTVNVQLGKAGDRPVPGDYDGDSKTDQAVFRPSNGLWLIRRSSTNLTSQIKLGLIGDTPAPGDYDNDGKNDLAVYHGGEWTIKRSSDNQILTPSFGEPNAQPVEAAYAFAEIVPGLSINNVTITEGNAGAINAAFTVSLAAASTQTVSVHYATANGTATAPDDYTAKSGTLTFTPGQTSKTITVQIKGDTTHEANETFKVNLSAPVNATINDGVGQGTILNND